jgi:hypothetical protein
VRFGLSSLSSFANWGSIAGVPGKEEVHLLTDLIQAADANTRKPAIFPSTRSDDAAEVTQDGSGSTVHSLLHSDLGAQLPLHISLSRPVVLRTEQRASFTEALSEGVRSSGISSYVRPSHPVAPCLAPSPLLAVAVIVTAKAITPTITTRH